MKRLLRFIIGCIGCLDALPDIQNEYLDVLIRSESRRNPFGSTIFPYQTTNESGEESKEDAVPKNFTFYLNKDIELKAATGEEAKNIVMTLCKMAPLSKPISESLIALKKASLEPASGMSLTQMISTGSVSVAVVNCNDAAYLEKLAKTDIPSEVKFIINTDPAVAKELGYAFPGFVYCNRMDKVVVETELPQNPVTCLALAYLPIVFQLDTQNRALVGGLNTGIFFLIGGAKETYEQVRKRYFNELKEQGKTKRFIVFNPNDIPLLMRAIPDNHKIGDILVFLEDTKKFYVEKVQPANVQAAIDQCVKREAKRAILSVEIPEDNEGKAVKVASYHTVEQAVIKDTSVDRIIFFSAAACNFCTEALPRYQKFGEMQSDVKVYVYSLDFNDNPVDFGVKVEGYPTIYFLKKGSSEMVKISEVRTLINIIKKLEELGATGISYESMKGAVDGFEQQEKWYNDFMAQIKSGKNPLGDMMKGSEVDGDLGDLETEMGKREEDMEIDSEEDDAAASKKEEPIADGEKNEVL